MKFNDLAKTQKIVKDLILFDSVWSKRNKIKAPCKINYKQLSVYRDLVKGSFKDLIRNIYPTTYELLQKDWDKLLSKYIEVYPPYSPILIKVAECFPEFLSTQKDIMRKYSFISELAYYEWVEVEIYEREEDRGQKTAAKGEPRSQSERENRKSKLLNPIHEVCNFQYPTPEIAEMIDTYGKKSVEKKILQQPTSVLIYRDPKDLSVRYFELSASTQQYIELLQSNMPHEMIIFLLANAYGISQEDYKAFKKEADGLQKTLTKNRVLI